MGCNGSTKRPILTVAIERHYTSGYGEFGFIAICSIAGVVQRKTKAGVSRQLVK